MNRREKKGWTGDHQLVAKSNLIQLRCWQARANNWWPASRGFNDPCKLILSKAFPANQLNFEAFFFFFSSNKAMEEKRLTQRTSISDISCLSSSIYYPFIRHFGLFICQVEGTFFNIRIYWDDNSCILLLNFSRFCGLINLIKRGDNEITL